MKKFFVALVIFSVPLVSMAASVESSKQVQDSISSLSPAAQKFLHPVFGYIDSAREWMAHELGQALDWSKSQIGKKVESPTSGFINTPNASTQNKTASTLWTIVATIVLYVLTILLVIVDSAPVFYILLLVFVLYVLWRIFRRWRRGY